MQRRLPKWLIIALAALLLVVIGEVVFLAAKWPFTRERVAEGLGGQTKCRVRFGEFDLTFFPHPGFVARNIVFERDGAPPLAVANAMKVDGTWLALFTLQRRVKSMAFDALRISIPERIPPGVEAVGEQKSDTVIGELLLHGATFSLARRGNSPLRWELRRARFTDVARDSAIGFDVQVLHPEPPGLVVTRGSFGPVKQSDFPSSPLKGVFEFQKADLGKYENLAGVLASKGEFSGRVGEIHVRGDIDIPRFEVNNSGKPVHLTTYFQATVDGMNGDVALSEIQSRFGGTHLAASGTIEGGARKTVALKIRSVRARVQDVVGLFTKGGRSAMRGPISFGASVLLPPGEQRFLQRVRLEGRFGIDDAEFTKSNTRRKLNELSARARTEASETETEALVAAESDVLSDLGGSVTLRDGTAHLNNVSFRVPGAAAKGGGTYNLISKRINLTGTVAMQATVSEASRGLKSILLKPFDTLFRKKERRAGAVLPVSITGTYPHPKFSVALTR